MALRIPAPQIENIKKLLELPNDKIEGFLKALSESGPQFNVDDLSGEVADRTELPRELVEGVLVVLASLCLTRDSEGTPLEIFLDRDVLLSLKSAGTFSENDADAEWAKLRKFLMTALSLENSIGTTAKAGYILTQHERIFSGARIMTDVRPIFHLNVSEKPNAAVIIHMLSITQRDNSGNRSDQYFALDSNDLLRLKVLLDRALNKEKTLKEIMAASNIAVLNPKDYF